MMVHHTYYQWQNRSDLFETFYNVELVIGFINEPYIALESDEEEFLDIGVISGDLQRDVVFQLTFSSGSALGKVM